MLAQWGFFQKIWLSHTTIYGPVTPCLVSGKTNEPIPRKLTGKQMDGWKDGQTLFYRTLLAMTGSQKSKKKKVNNNSTQFNPNSTFWKTKQIQWKDTSIFIYLLNHDHHCYMQKLEVSDILLKTCFEMDGLWFTKHRFL